MPTRGTRQTTTPCTTPHQSAFGSSQSSLANGTHKTVKSGSGPYKTVKSGSGPYKTVKSGVRHAREEADSDALHDDPSVCFRVQGL